MVSVVPMRACGTKRLERVSSLAYCAKVPRTAGPSRVATPYMPQNSASGCGHSSAGNGCYVIAYGGASISLSPRLASAHASSKSASQVQELTAHCVTQVLRRRVRSAHVGAHDRAQAARATGSSAARGAGAHAQLHLPGLRRTDAPLRRGCLRATGVRAGALPSDPPRSPEARLYRLQGNGAVARALATDRTRTTCWPLPSYTPTKHQSRCSFPVAGVPRLWTCVRDERPAGDDAPPAVLFRCSPVRRGERPREHLKDFGGVLHADAYAGFAALYEHRPGRPAILEAACWAEARSGFFDLHHATCSPIAAEALARRPALRD